MILLSIGSEESFSEGIKAFGERHFAELPRESTFFLCLESLGSPHLLVLRGEGFLKMREYPPRALALYRRARRGARHLALSQPAHCTTAPTASSRWRPATRPRRSAPATTSSSPAFYHWPNDSPSNVDFGTVADGIRLTEAAVRRLDERWL